MEKDINTTKGRRTVADLTSEERRVFRRKLKDIIIKEFSYLAGSDESIFYWAGAMSDLMELTHVAWLTGEIADSKGNPVSFRDLAFHVADVLGCHCPKNPYSLAERCRMRKSVKRLPIMDRYLKLMVECGVKNPLSLDMKFK